VDVILHSQEGKLEKKERGRPGIDDGSGKKTPPIDTKGQQTPQAGEGSTSVQAIMGESRVPIRAKHSQCPNVLGGGGIWRRGGLSDEKA